LLLESESLKSTATGRTHSFRARRNTLGYKQKPRHFYNLEAYLLLDRRAGNRPAVILLLEPLRAANGLVFAAPFDRVASRQ
jgi:hypothetical protein